MAWRRYGVLLLGVCWCSVAAGACVDRAKQCAAWAARGECKQNVAFMQSNCPKACGMCDRASEEGETPPAQLQAPADPSPAQPASQPSQQKLQREEVREEDELARFWREEDARRLRTQSQQRLQAQQRARQDRALATGQRAGGEAQRTTQQPGQRAEQAAEEAAERATEISTQLAGTQQVAVTPQSAPVSSPQPGGAPDASAKGGLAVALREVTRCRSARAECQQELDKCNRSTTDHLSAEQASRRVHRRVADASR